MLNTQCQNFIPVPGPTGPILQQCPNSIRFTVVIRMSGEVYLFNLCESCWDTTKKEWPDLEILDEKKAPTPNHHNFPQLAQLRRHDPAAAASAERLLAAGFLDAAAHRIRQAMHRLMDRLITARKSTQEVSNV